MAVAIRRGMFTLDYYVKLKNGKRKRVWETTPWPETDAKGRQKAEQLLARRMNDISDGKYQLRSEQKDFDDLCAAYLSYVVSVRNIRELTEADYRTIVETRLQVKFGGRKLRSINTADVEQYIGEMRRGTPIESPKTLHYIHKTIGQLSRMFKYALKHDWVALNPCALADRPKIEPVEATALDIEQVKQLIDAAEWQRDKVLFRMAVETGMRQGELLALQWTDIDWTRGLVHVRRAYRRGIQSEPKSKASKRSVDLTPRMLTELEAWRPECPDAEPDLNLVFPTKDGMFEANYTLLRRHFHPARDKAQLPKVRFHDLRHSTASLLADMNINVKSIQKHMGHANVQTTLNIYTHRLRGDSAVSNAMTRMFGGDGKDAPVDPPPAEPTAASVLRFPARAR